MTEENFGFDTIIHVLQCDITYASLVFIISSQMTSTMKILLWPIINNNYKNMQLNIDQLYLHY